MKKNGAFVLMAAAALMFAARADFDINLDFKDSPIRDIRKANCNSLMGFNAALENVWGVANDDYWFVTNRIEAARVLKAAGAKLMRLQCMNGWFRRRNDPKRPTNPKAAFEFYKANGMKVFVCLECWSTNAVEENVEIVRWLVDNKFKDQVAGIEMGNETYGSPKYPDLAPFWAAFINRAEKIWPKLPLGLNIGELFELNPDLAHLRNRMTGDEKMPRDTYFSAARFNQFSTKFILALKALGVLDKIDHIIWHAYGAETPYSCSYYGFQRFRNYVAAFPELKGKRFWLTEIRERSDEDNHCQAMFRESLIMAHYALMAICQPEMDGFCHHQLTALSGAIYQSNGRDWYIQWYDGTQNSFGDARAPYDLPHMEVGHCGVMYRILTEAIARNPILLRHGTSKESGTEDGFFTSARVMDQVYQRRKWVKERVADRHPDVEGECEWVAATTPAKNKLCLMMVNTKPTAEKVRVTVAGKQFAAPSYRTLSCPAKFLDCREIPGEGHYWRQVSWEDTQSGYSTWSNYDTRNNTYKRLPSGVITKCDDMIVTIEPHTVQSVEVFLRNATTGD